MNEIFSIIKKDYDSFINYCKNEDLPEDVIDFLSTLYLLQVGINLVKILIKK